MTIEHLRTVRNALLLQAQAFDAGWGFRPRWLSDEIAWFDRAIDEEIDR